MEKKILLSTTLAVLIILFMANVSSAITFGPAVNLGSDVNTINNEMYPDISSNGLDLYLSSDRGEVGSSGSNDLYKSTRLNTASSFGVPSNLGATINSAGYDGGPSVTYNNAALFFSSNRTGNHDIYVSTVSGVFSVSALNTASADIAPDISSDGLRIFWSSARVDLGAEGGMDIYTATRADIGNPWGGITNISAINSSFSDRAPTISSDGLSLYFESDRSGGFGEFGGFDLYVSTRPDLSSVFGAAVNLGAGVNSTFDERAPSISLDGSTLYFSSDRDVGFGGSDIYQATAVPEPATIALLGIGLAGLGGTYLRRKRKQKEDIR